MNISVADMKANLSEILRKAAAGEEIHVFKHGKPYVKIAADAVEKPSLPRIGALKGKIWIADDFDELDPEWDEYTK